MFGFIEIKIPGRKTEAALVHLQDVLCGIPVIFADRVRKQRSDVIEILHFLKYGLKIPGINVEISTGNAPTAKVPDEFVHGIRSPLLNRIVHVQARLVVHFSFLFRFRFQRVDWFV